MELTILVAGGLIGHGVHRVAQAWFRPPPSLGALVASARPRGVTPTPAEYEHAARRDGFEHVAERLASVLGLDVTAGARRNLRTVGRSPATHMGAKLAGAAAGVVFALGASVAYSGGAPRLHTGLAAVIVMAGLGFVAPDAALSLEAARRRDEFRDAHSLFLLLAAGVVAGGGGVESALHLAARAGDHWANDRLLFALERAQSHVPRQSPWNALGQLGEELGVAELEKLAASVALAGTEGAKLRDSLLQQASDVRSKLRHDAERLANARTDRMAVPLVGMAVAFLGFIVHAALYQITVSR